MHKLVKYCLGLALAMTASTIYAEDDSTLQPLKIGVVPYLSARALVTSYEPMRLYLEQAMGRPVKIYTAAGFKPFFLNAIQGDYDLVITAAHFARILQKEHKFKPLVKFSPGVHSLLMTKLDSSLKTPQELKGQVIAVPDQLALSSIVSMAWLRENGMKPETDYRILEVPSFPSALLAVQKGDAMAAVSATPVLSQIPKELRESLRTLVDAGEYLQFIFLTHPRMGVTASNRISKELLNFSNESNEGKQFFSSTGFGAITPLSPKDMNSLDRYISETKRLLSATP